MLNYKNKYKCCMCSQKNNFIRGRSRNLFVWTFYLSNYQLSSNSNLYFSINILHIYTYPAFISTLNLTTQWQCPNDNNKRRQNTWTKNIETAKMVQFTHTQPTNLSPISTIKWNRTTKTCCTHISHTSESLLPSSNAAFSPKNLRNSDTRGC